MYEVRHISVSVERPPTQVYAFAANLDNLPHWASGVGNTVRREGDGYVLEGGPLGKITYRPTPKNDLGVLDHDVTLPSGQTVHNPLRVLPNGEGSELVFSVFRLPGVSESDFARDTATVEKDLRTLKRLIEKAR